MASSVCCSVGAAGGGGGGGGSGSLQPKLKQNILQDQAEALADLLLSLGIEVHALLQHSHYCHLIGIQSIPGLGLYCVVSSFKAKKVHSTLTLPADV